MVHAQAAGTTATVPPEDIEAQAAAIEEELVEVEEEQAAELEAAEEAAEEKEAEAATARDRARPDA
jgi:hypothetical protein